MRGAAAGYESDFPRSNGTHKLIDDNDGQVTITSSDTLTGGHSAIIMEYTVNGSPITQMIDLVTGSDMSGALGSGADKDSDGSFISIREGPLMSPDDKSFDYRKFAYTAYDMTDSQKVMLYAAIRRFKEKNQKGRYSYRLAGGFIGRVITRPGTRGVNCADFIIKVMKEAKIVKISEKPISTPIGVSKNKGKKY